jgi:hypothetical protein
MTHDPATCQCRYQAHRCAQCELADAEADRLRMLSRRAVLVPFEPGVCVSEPVVHVAMSEVSDPNSFGPMTHTRPADCTCFDEPYHCARHDDAVVAILQGHPAMPEAVSRPLACTCRGNLLPCAFCRGAAIPDPDHHPRWTRQQISAAFDLHHAASGHVRPQPAMPVPNGASTYLSGGIPTLIPAELQRVIATLTAELVAERRFHDATKAALATARAAIERQGRENERRATALTADRRARAAFVDPDDPAPPDTRPTMPATALRQPGKTGWQVMR